MKILFDFTNEIFCNGEWGFELWKWVRKYELLFQIGTASDFVFSFIELCEKLEVKGRDRDTSFRLRLRNGTFGVKHT